MSGMEPVSYFLVGIEGGASPAGDKGDCVISLSACRWMTLYHKEAVWMSAITINPIMMVKKTWMDWESDVLTAASGWRMLLVPPNIHHMADP